MNIKELLPGVKINIPLKKYTSFKIGGPAKYFFVAKNKTELIKAILVAKKLKLPFFILGGGSNLLVSDKGFKGLIIKIKNQKSKIKNKNQKPSFHLWKRGGRRERSSLRPPKIIEVESGMLLSKLVNIAFKKNLSGLEWAVGIPGTVGGAIRGNAGAFGKSMKDVVKEVEVLEVGYGEIGSPLEIRSLRNKDCKFGYRDSIFKHTNSATLGLRPRGMRMRPCECPKLIILSTVLQLKKGNKKKIKNEIKKNLEQRKETQPLNFPSAGSVFKNPPGFFAAELGEENKFSSSSFAAARLIEKCDLKGKRIGNVKVSEKHANFIVNLGKGKAKDVKKLINLIKNKVKKKFGIVLEEEIQSLGFQKSKF